MLGRTKVYQLIAIFTFLGFLNPTARAKEIEPKSALEWTMINVNVTDKQGDSHLLQLHQGSEVLSNILIDTGDQGQWIVPFLKAHQVNKIDLLIISHPHHDHYGAIKEILAANILISKAYFNIPLKEICDPEKPWGCDYEDVLTQITALQDHKTVVKTAKAKDVIFDQSGVKIQVLYAYDGIHTPLKKRTDINDTSLILLLTYGNNRVLFTGDLNRPLGTYLAKHGKNIRADILKVPHHGTEGVAPNEFFDAVHPKVALVPSPRTLWQSDRSKRIREYFEKSSIKTYVNGLEGDVMVQFRKKGFKIVSGENKVLRYSTKNLKPQEP